MSFITQPNKEGETKECNSCKCDIVGRLTDYKGRFPDKLQWQAKNERKAHYDKNGNCKENTTPDSTSSPPQVKPPLNILDEPTQKMVKNEAEFIVHIKSLVEETVKIHTAEVLVDPNSDMIWEITSLIWKKYFGDNTRE